MLRLQLGVLLNFGSELLLRARDLLLGRREDKLVLALHLCQLLLIARLLGLVPRRGLCLRTLHLGLQLKRCLLKEGRVLGLGSLEQSLQLVQIIGVADRDSFEPLDLGRQLIDDAPGYHLLTSDPLTGLFIVCFPKEQLQVE